ncbi:MAG: DUF4157 domain-containing protein [Acidobacteriota bacterium]
MTPPVTATPSRFRHDFTQIPVRAGLTVSRPEDAAEQEAARVAESTSSSPVVSRFCGHGKSAAHEAPESVARELASPGRPLDPLIRQQMEQRLGADFAQVRIHSDAAAQASAWDLTANAYTAGQHVVFGAGRFAPATHEGRRLLAHELTHVAQQTPPNVVHRDVVRDAALNVVSYEFRIGHELTELFAKKAKSLTADGTLTTADIRKLEATSTAARDTVSDHERMFMAALLTRANVHTLQATIIRSNTAITFPISTITDRQIRQVIAVGRSAVPASVTAPEARLRSAVSDFDIAAAQKEYGKIETAAEKEVIRLIGHSLRRPRAAVLSFARTQGVYLRNVLDATLNAASDDTPSDRLMAAAAYVTAAAAAHPLAGDIMSGRIHVDALAPAKFLALQGVPPNTRAMYIAGAPLNPAIAGLKGDTIYMPTTFSIDSLSDRANVIHELQHAQDDKAQSPTAQPAFPPQFRLEMDAYKAQARYILEQLSGLAARAQSGTAATVGATAGDLEMTGVLIETKRDLTRFQPLAELLFAALPPPRRQNATAVANVLAVPTPRLDALLQAQILAAYGITTGSSALLEGQAGESLIHWIHRL